MSSTASGPQLLSVEIPYADRPTSDHIVKKALEDCPWRDTDHWPPETRGENYCTWCDGYVTGVLWMARTLGEAFEGIAKDLGLEVSSD